MNRRDLRLEANQQDIGSREASDFLSLTSPAIGPRWSQDNIASLDLNSENIFHKNPF